MKRKYRIISNGNKFRIQHKKFLRWRTLGYYSSGSSLSWIPNDFPTVEEAKECIKEQMEYDKIEKSKWVVYNK